MDLIENTKEVGQRAKQELEKLHTAVELDAFFAKFLAKKGEIPTLMGNMKAVPAELRATFGKAVNDVRTSVNELFERKKA